MGILWQWWDGTRHQPWLRCPWYFCPTLLKVPTSLLPKPVSHHHQEERGGFSLSNGREVIVPWGSHSPFSSRNVLERKAAGWGYHSHLTTNKSQGAGCAVSEQLRSWASPSSVISYLCLALFLGGSLFWGDYLLPYKVGFSSAFLHCARKVSWLLLSQPPPCSCSPSLPPCTCSPSPSVPMWLCQSSMLLCLFFPVRWEVLVNKKKNWHFIFTEIIILTSASVMCLKAVPDSKYTSKLPVA